MRNAGLEETHTGIKIAGSNINNLRYADDTTLMAESEEDTLMRYFQAGGSPEEVICLLSDNYTAVAQTINLLAQWLIQTGVEPVQIQETHWGFVPACGLSLVATHRLLTAVASLVAKHGLLGARAQ